MGEKAYIYVSKELAEQYEQLATVEAQEEAVKKVISRKRIDLEDEQEMLSDTLLQFKSVCLKHKIELEKVYAEQADKIYKLWECCGDVSSNISRHAASITSEISTINDQIDRASRRVSDLKSKTDSLNIYGAEKIIELARTVANLDDATKDILAQILAGKKQ